MEEEDDRGVGGVVRGIVDVALERYLVVGELDSLFFEGGIDGGHFGRGAVKILFGVEKLWKEKRRKGFRRREGSKKYQG